MLESTFQPNYSPLPLIVYDFQVLAHDIHKYLEAYAYITECDPELFTSLIKAAWAYRLNYGIDTLKEPLEQFTAIVVNDSKGITPPQAAEHGTGYWRHIVASELGLQEYKIGRSIKPDSFSLVCQIGITYIHSPNSTFYYYEQEYMEADDIAGKLARLKRHSDPKSVAGSRQMLLYTVDGDWQGLVSDEHNIVWCNVGPWLPRMRDDAGVIDYYLRKNGVKITKARECYDIKTLYGDAGDGLKPGSPLRLYDLYNEDHEYSFSENTSSYLTEVLQSTRNSKKIEHVQNTSEFFKKFGLIPPVLKYPIAEEIECYHEKAHKERQNFVFAGVSPMAKRICKEKPVEVQPLCIKIGKNDETTRLALKNAEEDYDKCDKLDTLCRNVAKKLINSLKNLRKTLKSELESLT